MSMGTPGPAQKVPDDEIVEAIMLVDDPVASVADIHEGIDLSRVTLRDRLNKLEKKGVVKSKKIGPARAWWISLS